MLLVAQETLGIKQIEIVHADVLKYNKQMKVHRLIGHVVCKHEHTLFYCDSAYLYDNQSLRAFGEVRIVSDSLTITAQSLLYDASTHRATLEQNVIGRDNQMELKTEVLEYHTMTRMAYYPHRATIRRNEHILVSDRGYYFLNSKVLAFKNNVVLTSPKYVIKTDTLLYDTHTDVAHFNAPTIILMEKDYLYCEKGWYDTKSKKAWFSKHPLLVSDYKKLYADSLFFDEQKHEGMAYFHVRLIDTSQHTIVTGQFAQYNILSEKAIMTPHPVLEKIQAQKDTLFLTADTLYYEKKDSFIVARCIHQSQIYHTQFQARARDIIYYQKDSVIHLIDEPRFWFDKNQANSKAASIYLKSATIEKIVLDTNVIIMQEVDTIYHNKYNQIAGRKMRIIFENDSIKNIYVDGNAQVYYFVQNSKKQWTGLNKAKCGSIRVDFVKNEIEKIVFAHQPEAVLIPIKKIQIEKERLSDFQWQPQLRPIRKYFSINE